MKCVSPGQRVEAYVSGVPQVGQKPRVTPVDEAWRAGEPAVQRQWPSVTPIQPTKGAPEARWQEAQWQIAWNRMAPGSKA